MQCLADIVQSQHLLVLGGFGSGKSQLALDMAMNFADPLKNQGQQTVLVDLDVITPYFRSSLMRQVLEGAGVMVIAPNFAGTTLDVPSVSGQVDGVLSSSQNRVVVDVGGDTLGATLLGRYHTHLQKTGYTSVFVINICRPLQQTADEVCQLIDLISKKARITVHGLVNNTHLLDQTTAQDLLEGHAVAEEVSHRTGIPIVGIMGLPQVLATLPESFQTQWQSCFLPVTTRTDWQNPMKSYL